MAYQTAGSLKPRCGSLQRIGLPVVGLRAIDRPIVTAEAATLDPATPHGSAAHTRAAYVGAMPGSGASARAATLSRSACDLTAEIS